MTDKGYDPFSYGQVPMASGGAKTDAMAESPEDMLFHSGPPARAGGTDSDWDPPPSFQGGGAGEFDFGADVLGEQGRKPAPAAAAAPAPARTLPSTPKPRPATALPERQAAPQGMPGKGMPGQGAPGQGTHGQGAPAKGAPAHGGETGGAPRQVRPQVARPTRRPQRDQPMITPILPAPRTGPMAMVMPALVLAAGEGAAMWLHFGLHNTVMAGLAAALGLALAGVTWFALRR